MEEEGYLSAKAFLGTVLAWPTVLGPAPAFPFPGGSETILLGNFP